MRDCEADDITIVVVSEKSPQTLKGEVEFPETANLMFCTEEGDIQGVMFAFEQSVVSEVWQVGTVEKLALMQILATARDARVPLCRI